jgi:cation diffusion facilitator family transporter
MDHSNGIVLHVKLTIASAIIKKVSLDVPLLNGELIDNAPCNLILNNNVPTKCKTTRNVNLHAAYLHALADLAQSVAVLIAGLIIWWEPTWQIADPICTLIFSVVVCFSTIGVIKASLNVLMEKVPPGLDWDEVHDAVCQVSGVSNVHNLHIWSISHDAPALSLHATAENVEQACCDIKRICHNHNITKLTLQIQSSTYAGECITCTGECETATTRIFD